MFSLHRLSKSHLPTVHNFHPSGPWRKFTAEYWALHPPFVVYAVLHYHLPPNKGYVVFSSYLSCVVKSLAAAILVASLICKYLIIAYIIYLPSEVGKAIRGNTLSSLPI
jgi:hypothetical protein